MSEPSPIEAARQPGDRSRDELPKPGSRLFLTDAGLETFLSFDRGIELPHFASFPLLDGEAGLQELRDYYEPFLALAAEHGLGFVLESPTWRANPRWAAAIGYDAAALAESNRRAIALMEELRDAAGEGAPPIVISGNIGSHDDGYAPEELLSAEQAADYHSVQIDTFAETAADLVTTMTMTYAEEAIGIARAAKAAEMPAVISFTVETDGRLASGQPLGEAIEQVEADLETDVAYFMINCAHPTHFDSVVSAGGAWLERIGGLRANASRCSHAELDEATELDGGDPIDLARRYAELRRVLPRLNVLGGCCGTDYRHVAEICAAVNGD